MPSLTQVASNRKPASRIPDGPDELDSLFADYPKPSGRTPVVTNRPVAGIDANEFSELGLVDPYSLQGQPARLAGRFSL